MTTFDDLIASIHTSLHSYSGVQEQVTWLTTGCTDSDTNLEVAAMRPSCEDWPNWTTSSSTWTRPTPTASHSPRSVGATEEPSRLPTTRTPRSSSTRPSLGPRSSGRSFSVSRVCFPTLYQVKTYTFTYDASQLAFDLPDDVESVLEVKWETPEALNHYETVGRWAFDGDSPRATARASPSPTTCSPPRTCRWSTGPSSAPSAGSDTLASVGMGESYADLILYGVTARMVRFLQPAAFRSSPPRTSRAPPTSRPARPAGLRTSCTRCISSGSPKSAGAC